MPGTGKWGIGRRARRGMLVLAAAVLLPYAVTLAWNGSLAGYEGTAGFGGLGGNGLSGASRSGQRVYLSGRQGYVDEKEYLAAAVVSQIPMDYEMEAVKAQAVIARTWLYRQRDGSGQIVVEDPDAVYPDGAEQLRDGEHFPEYLEKAKQAVEETDGLVILCDGQLIEPLFHRASAGKTRAGDAAHPYLQAADSSFDLEADGYLTIREWTPEEFAALTAGGGENGGSAGERLPDTLQLVSQDSSGYVAEYQIGSHIYTGDEVREMLSLPSSAFTLKLHEGNVQAVCRGQGHGLGLSQYGASHLAGEGLSAVEILNYYYYGVTVDLENISESHE